MEIRDHDVRAVINLGHELAEFRANEAYGALDHCLTELARLVGAANVGWIGAARQSSGRPDDPVHGWRPRAVEYLYENNPAQQQAVGEVISRIGTDATDPMTRRMVELAGRTRALLRHEMVDDETWNRSWLVNEVLRPHGIASRVIGAHTLDEATESYIFLDRYDGERPFGPRERDLLHIFLLGGRAFHRHQVLARMEVQPRLTPRERQVLALLLSERSEREIAEAVGLTYRTTHQHVVSILRKFGVRGRVGLMAFWLRKGGI